jgi:CTP:molybdopterin cytidylyltransferase MocA
MTTAAVLLAAGGGTRFRGRGHKLRAVLGDRTVFEHALDAVLGAGLDEVIVVEGAVGLHDLVPEGIAHVVNPRWQGGIATSLHTALDLAARRGHDAVVVGLADQPHVTSEAWRAVATSDAPIAVASYGGRRGNPVRLAASVWDLLPEDGDEGARALMRERPDLVTEVPCLGSAVDVDTVEDLEQLGGNP